MKVFLLTGGESNSIMRWMPSCCVNSSFPTGKWFQFSRPCL